ALGDRGCFTEISAKPRGYIPSENRCRLGTGRVPLGALSPNPLEKPEEVSAKNLLNACGLVTARFQKTAKLSELIGPLHVRGEEHEVRRVLRVVDAVADAGRPPLRILAGDHAFDVVDGGRSTIGAEADMILAADIHRMFDVVDHILGVVLAARIHERHKEDA